MTRSIKSTLARAAARLGALGTALLVPALALAEEAEHGAHGEHGFDTTALIASFVNFAILIALFTYLFRDKVKSFLTERRAEVEQQLQEAARLKAEAEVKHKEYSERLAKLDQELGQIKADMIAAGKAERDRIVAEAEHKAARLRREAEFIVEQHVKQLRADLSHEAASEAIAAAEQLLLRATTTYDQQRLAQDYLKSLSETAPVSAPKKQPLTQPESRV
jgi:F-type H+-transporting ATPase subunit b